MRDKIQRFMWGRYGNDRFNQFLMAAALFFLLLRFFGIRIAYIPAVILMACAYYRMFSRQINKRIAENQRYLKVEWKVRSFFAKKKQQWSWNGKQQSGNGRQWSGNGKQWSGSGKQRPGRKKRQSGQKQYRIYKCPKCRQKLRVPRGRGKIAIRCRKCGNEFIRRS